MKEMNFDALKEFLGEQFDCASSEIEISPLSGGFSNLTYLLKTPSGKFALRRPPFGYKISTAHDMGRESKVLEALQKAHYSKGPKPILFHEDEKVLGAPFFIMEFVEGKVLRNKLPTSGPIPTEDTFRKLSQNTIDSLLELHKLELEDSGLIQLGKPEGYVQRQVFGWTDRYKHSQTEPISEMDKTAEWLINNIPQTENKGFIHNDFKYDNLVLNPDNLFEIKAVLDWEMATVGDPLMDLGTSLAYWAQVEDSDILKMFNLTHLPGNFTRNEVIEYYSKHSNLKLNNILFYYVFGLFKVAVIAQQIYKRFKLGQANDPRFASLIEVVKVAAKKAEKSILTEKI
ncbi:phosphotransferase family protein [Algoriphagus kandeliae]|uniref:Phosphotransferase family protein n=1 Tax=Algoriphagus kandeliae TaxID=2562278 RepID=A0A4Y9QZ53_9BACT|nr:phosphotransferase family protein [Algoriphagus kandeliae]TFV97834.1 phosphotransferase family protein [Algoriphagus kandeliae]